MVPTTLRQQHLDSFTATLLESIEDGVIVLDAEFRYQLFNRFMERLSGMRMEDVLGRCAFDLFPHLKANGIDKLFERALNGEAVRSPDVHYHVPSTGRSGWVVGQYSPMMAAGGERIGVVGIIRDITQRKKTEELLRQSEQWFRSIIENASELVTVVDADAVMKYVSPTSRRILGFSPQELLGTHVFSFVHPEDIELARQEWTRLLGRRGGSMPLEFRCRHRDGGWRTLVSTARNLLDDPSVNGIVVNARDVSEQRRLELQFQHTQKMEAVGRLAGGLAHDFNNLLAVIQGNAQLAAGSLGEGDLESARYEVHEIGQAAERAAVLTRQLLTFSRQQQLSLEEVLPNAIVEGIGRLLDRALGEGVKLVLAMDPGAGSVRADRGQLEQVLMNLAVNARDAMPSGGTVMVETANVEIAPEVARFHPGAKPGAYVMLSVSDTGLGMTREVKARMFEPFFTTKERGKGTGLGLATVYGVVQQCGGFIWVDSEPGRGTTFKIHLPRVT